MQNPLHRLLSRLPEVHESNQIPLLVLVVCIVLAIAGVSLQITVR